jgi:uncharacterized protein
MLLRFVIKNLFSFKDETEFNLFPGKASRLKHHKYVRKGIEVLKLSAIYGANGAGKSNVIKAMSLLKNIVVSGMVPNGLNRLKFKLSPASQKEPLELGIEFFIGNHIYYYSIAINNNQVVDEYFADTGEDRKEDTMIFHRTARENKTSIEFFKEFEEDEGNVVLRKIITNDLLKENQPLFSLLNTISNNAFIDIKNAFFWFANGLQILFPFTELHNIAHELDANKDFKKFANDLMCSFNTGISNLKIDIKEIKEFLGDDNQKELERITAELNSNPEKTFGIMIDRNNGDEVSVVKEKDRIVAKRLFFEHLNENNEGVDFNIKEESDGTKRLLEYIPAFHLLIHNSYTFIIDEIERSIHPLIIRELISKFSKDEKTEGQLIFTTHETTLLDQDVFRTDEVWFADKNKSGVSSLSSLAEYREHNTIDIRKGYLNGRYKGVPNTGRLEDLNWNNYADAEQK